DLTRTQGNLLGAGQVTAVVRWFNVWAGIEKRMPAGSVVTLSGLVKKRSGRLEFAMLEAISAAKESICLETYILASDSTGDRFKLALVERARAGVKVRLIYDAV